MERSFNRGSLMMRLIQRFLIASSAFSHRLKCAISPANRRRLPRITRLRIVGALRVLIAGVLQIRVTHRRFDDVLFGRIFGALVATTGGAGTMAAAGIAVAIGDWWVVIMAVRAASAST